MSDRRPEDILDELLDQLLAGEIEVGDLPGEDVERIQPHLEAALWLEMQGKELSPSSSFVRDSWRSTRLDILRESSRASWWTKIKRFWTQTFMRRVAVAATLLLLMLVIFLGPNVVSAAQDALPGDRLYPVKLSLERAELFFARSEEEEIKLLAEQATERLKEAQRAADSTEIEKLEFALQAYQETTSKNLDLLGSVKDDDLSPISDALSQTALEQTNIFETLSMTVTELNLHDQSRLQGSLDAASETVSAFREILLRSDPLDSPSTLSTPTPTPTTSSDEGEGPTPDRVSPTETATPSRWWATSTPMLDRTPIWSWPSSTPSFDLTKSPEDPTPTPSETPTPADEPSDSNTPTPTPSS